MMDTCKDCQNNTCDQFDTWHNPVWVNREMIWSNRADAWIWRVLKPTTPAKAAAKAPAPEGTWESLNIRDSKEEQAWIKSMQNWTDEEVDELLGRD